MVILNTSQGITVWDIRLVYISLKTDLEALFPHTLLHYSSTHKMINHLKNELKHIKTGCKINAYWIYLPLFTDALYQSTLPDDSISTAVNFFKYGLTFISHNLIIILTTQFSGLVLAILWLYINSLNQIHPHIYPSINSFAHPFILSDRLYQSPATIYTLTSYLNQIQLNPISHWMIYGTVLSNTWTRYN